MVNPFIFEKVEKYHNLMIEKPKFHGGRWCGRDRNLAGALQQCGTPGATPLDASQPMISGPANLRPGNLKDKIFKYAHSYKIFILRSSNMRTLTKMFILRSSNMRTLTTNLY